MSSAFFRGYLPAGSMLHHGTAEEGFDYPDGPAWFSDHHAVARRHGPRVLTYRTKKPLTVAWIEGPDGMEELKSRLFTDSRDDVAKWVCEAGLDGWHAPNFFSVPTRGSDTMLCTPKNALECVVLPSGHRTGTRIFWHGTTAAGARRLLTNPRARNLFVAEDRERAEEYAFRAARREGEPALLRLEVLGSIEPDAWAAQEAESAGIEGHAGQWVANGSVRVLDALVYDFDADAWKPLR